jgi:hypothetical protein
MLSSRVTTTGADGMPSTARARTMPPRWRTFVLTVHVSVAVALLGADLGLLVLGMTGLRGADPATVYPAMHVISTWLIAPLALLTLGTGALQARFSRWGFTRYWWVTAKLVITSILTGLVLLVVVPGLDRAADAATGASPAEFLTEARRTAFVITPSVSVVLLVVMVGLGIYKPGRGRRPRSGRSET